jgi:hypothetical protein
MDRFRIHRSDSALIAKDKRLPYSSRVTFHGRNAASKAAQRELEAVRSSRPGPCGGRDTTIDRRRKSDEEKAKKKKESRRARKKKLDGQTWDIDKCGRGSTAPRRMGTRGSPSS